MPDPAPPPAEPQPWRAEEPLQHHTFTSTRHGFVVEDCVEACERAELVALLAQYPSMEGVYVPGAEGLVPGLREEYRDEAVRRARRDAGPACSRLRVRDADGAAPLRIHLHPRVSVKARRPGSRVGASSE